MSTHGLQDIDVGGFNVRNLKDAGSPQDAVTLAQLKDKTNEYKSSVTFLSPLAGTRYPVLTCNKALKILTVEAAIKNSGFTQSVTYKTQSTTDLNSGWADIQTATDVTTGTILNTSLEENLIEGDIVMAYITAVTTEVEALHLTYTYTYDVVPTAKVRTWNSFDVIVQAEGSPIHKPARASATFGLPTVTVAGLRTGANLVDITLGLSGGSIQGNKQRSSKVDITLGFSEVQGIGETGKNQVSATMQLDLSVKADPIAHIRATKILYLSAKAERVTSGRANIDIGMSAVTASALKIGQNKINATLGLSAVSVTATAHKSAKVSAKMTLRLKSPSATKTP